MTGSDVPLGVTAATQIYNVSTLNAGGSELPTDQLRLFTNPKLTSGLVDLQDAGSGTITVEPVVGLSHQNSFFDCDTDGEMDFYAGGGTGAEPVCFFREDPAYLASTRLVPPIPTGVCNTTSPTFNYSPSAGATLTRNEEAASNDITRAISIMDGYMNRWFDRGSANDRRAVIVRGLCGGHRPISFYESTTDRIITINNGSDGSGTAYTDLGTPHPTWRFALGIGINNMPANANVGTEGDTFFRVDNHTPSVYGWPYHVTARRCFAHMTLESATAMILARDPGAKTLPGVSGTFHTRQSVDASAREIGWGIREWHLATQCRADSDPELPMCVDMLDHAAGWAAEIPNSTNFSATLRTTGQWSQLLAVNLTTGPEENNFMIAGYLRAVAALVGMVPDQPASVYALLAYMKVWPKWAMQNRGLFLAANMPLWTIFRETSGGNNVAASDASLVMHSEFVNAGGGDAGGGIAYSGTTCTLRSDSKLRWKPVNGRSLKFANFANMTLPGGMTANQRLYMINANTAVDPPTFEVSETQGGSAKSFTGSGNAALFLELHSDMQVTPGAGLLPGNGLTNDYIAGEIAGIRLLRIDDPTMQANVDEIADIYAYYDQVQATLSGSTSYWNFGSGA